MSLYYFLWDTCFPCLRKTRWLHDEAFRGYNCFLTKGITPPGEECQRSWLQRAPLYPVASAFNRYIKLLYAI